VHTERFTYLRKEKLKQIFDKKTISDTWREIVRSQLRKVDIPDLFDYYDFNYNIEDRSQTIRNEILSGNYVVAKPIVYRIEKKFGICRHLVIPQPTDALIIQVLTEHIINSIIKKQPSKNAFYSRDRHNIRHLHELDEYGLSTKELWKKLQKSIYNFADHKELIIVTDLSNYYDSINVEELRGAISLLVDTDEVLIDLLFKIIEEISWKPDYLPYRKKGLPTSNLEPIRLLAHSYLFELDHLIKRKTNDCFTRWMDDITIGVESRKEAVETISSISDILKSRGLALNLSKTDIYDYSKANFNFQIDLNKELDQYQKLQSSVYQNEATGREIRNKFIELIHLSNKPKQWDKVVKRFITLFTRLKCPKLLDYTESLYVEYPSLRPTLVYYLSEIGFNKKTSKTVLNLLNRLSIFDDVSLFQICHLVTTWKIPLDIDSRNFTHAFYNRILDISKSSKTYFNFYCTVWVMIKYAHNDELYKHIKKYKNLWQSDNFLRRQVTSSLAKLYHTHRKEEVKSLLNTQISSGIVNVVSVATQIAAFAQLKQLDKKLSPYLFYNHDNYPLNKFLVLCSVLNSDDIRDDDTIKKKILSTINDPFYLNCLELQYNIC